MSQPLDVLLKAISVSSLNSVHDASVQRPPPLVEEAAVGHLVGERVLESVLEIGEQRRLVQQLRRLQARQSVAQRGLG
jgi:hypothetical protein